MLEAGKRELRSVETWRATFAELIATFLFVFLGAGSVVVSGGLPNGDLDAARLVLIAMAHGFGIALLAYATANISGGHINPAVTFAALITKKISATRGLMFVVAQLVGAVAGALLLLATIPDATRTVSPIARGARFPIPRGSTAVAKITKTSAKVMATSISKPIPTDTSGPRA